MLCLGIKIFFVFQPTKNTLNKKEEEVFFLKGTQILIKVIHFSGDKNKKKKIVYTYLLTYFPESKAEESFVFGGVLCVSFILLPQA